MFYQNTKKLGLYLLLLVFFALACQEDDFPNEVDQDMDHATALVDSYLLSIVSNEDSNKSRKVSREAIDEIDHSITVLKFHKDKLVYKTNTDDLSGYNNVDEMTVTAYVNPGEYIFWFAGSGIYTLDDIDFDGESVEFLDQLPDYLRDYEMWVVKVPEDYDPEHNVLKYDIVYQTKDNAGVSIRLDPKIQIKNMEDYVDSVVD